MKQQQRQKQQRQQQQQQQRRRCEEPPGHPAAAAMAQMGLRAALLLGLLLLLLSAGTVRSDTQNQTEQVTPVTQQQQQNQTDQKKTTHLPYTIRLRIHQLQGKPAAPAEQQEKQPQQQQKQPQQQQKQPQQQQKQPQQQQQKQPQQQQQKQPQQQQQQQQIPPLQQQQHLPHLQPRHLPPAWTPDLGQPAQTDSWETPDPAAVDPSDLWGVQGPSVGVEQREPEAAESVSVRCGEDKVIIAVQQNFLGNGKLIHPSDLTLGGCSAVDAVDRILLFQTELQDCGSSVKMTEDAVIYQFPLVYLPTPIGNTSILKTNPAEVTVECYYQSFVNNPVQSWSLYSRGAFRVQVVSSGSLRPTWETYAWNTGAQQRLQFSLRLLADDWQLQRPSSVFHLNDVMHVEASVLQGHHVPLRVFVDSCVATGSPDPSAQPRYTFINNYGCLIDAKQTGEQSFFMQRIQENKLHFQIKTFQFHHDVGNSFYITCYLKATRLDAPIDSHHKACSFLTEAKRWVASGGDNRVCLCCDSSCSEPRRRRSHEEELQLEGTAVLGPILLRDPLGSVSALQTGHQSAAGSFLRTALLCAAGAVLTAAVLSLTSALYRRWVRKPAVYSVCK